jgi:hypothetical protein
VATKAQVIVGFAERGVELRRIFLYQKTEILAAVTDMAALAILLGNRPVQKLPVGNLA